jgi:hypothetical protein
MSLGLWILWNHRNACVFDGLSPCLNVAIRRTEEERDLWVLRSPNSPNPRSLDQSSS